MYGMMRIDITKELGMSCECDMREVSIIDAHIILETVCKMLKLDRTERLAAAIFITNESLRDGVYRAKEVNGFGGGAKK